MIGVTVNFLAIASGALVGTLLKKGIPERLTKMVISALSLCVIYIGISGALEGQNTLVLVISMVIGTLLGELLDLDGHFNKAAEKIGSKFQKRDSESKFTDGFVTGTLVFCIGAMAIMGSFDAGLTGDNTTLYTKALLDGISSIAFASAMGIGVARSAVCVFVYEGAFVLLSQYISGFISDYMVAEMTCAGSLLIMLIGLNMLGLTNIKVMNMLPAVFMPFLLCNFM